MISKNMKAKFFDLSSLFLGHHFKDTVLEASSEL